MSFASRHNKNSYRFTFQQIDKPEYFKLKDLYAKGFRDDKNVFTVRGAYINHGGRYGDSASLICDGFNINLPSHMCDEIRELIGNADDVAAINNGEVGGYVYEYTNKNGGTSYSVRWVDLEPMPF